MKKQFLVCGFVLFSMVTNAQSSLKKAGNPDTLNFATINKLMRMQQVVVENIPFSYLKISDSALNAACKGPYNETRKEQYEDLKEKINEVDEDLRFLFKRDFTFNWNFEESFTRSALRRLKVRYPQFNASGYESAYDFCASIKHRREDSLARAYKTPGYDYKKDSINNIKKRREDSVLLAQEIKDWAERKSECIKKFGTKNGNIITNGKIKLGFTEEMCDFSWGNTDYTTHNTYTKGGTLVKKVYESGTVLTFKKGILIAISE
jgi:hypothetical protein